MNAKELMLGNYVYDCVIGRNCQLTLDDFQCMNNFFKSNNHRIPYNPIALSEKWLFDFGFEKRYDDCYYYEMVLLNKKFELMDIDINVKCEYVHQLQILYFSLTGNHLQLVEPN
jgi:hypothetical protein